MESSFRYVAERTLELAQIEPEVQRIGRSLYEAFPSGARHPVRAFDAKAMELASHDHELRAALFRLVDHPPGERIESVHLPASGILVAAERPGELVRGGHST